ncbi:MAG: siderophore-interacting protein [Acidimicrobiales bacterium]
MPLLRVRREPPTFRRVSLRRTTSLSPHLLRVTLGGDGLRGYEPGPPAASVRMLLPRLGDPNLAIPTWNGNEYLHDDGARPTIRTYTPRHVDLSRDELDIDVVLHATGAVPIWLGSAEAGTEVGIAGPGRGYEIDDTATSFVLVGDESAIPAISQLLEHLPQTVQVRVLVEIANADARHELPRHPGCTVRWIDRPDEAAPGSTLVTAVEGLAIPDEARLWVAGEAASMQRIRRHLFEERAMPRAQAVVRGYWKSGKAGDVSGD